MQIYTYIYTYIYILQTTKKKQTQLAALQIEILVCAVVTWARQSERLQRTNRLFNINTYIHTYVWVELAKKSDNKTSNLTAVYCCCYRKHFTAPTANNWPDQPAVSYYMAAAAAQSQTPIPAWTKNCVENIELMNGLSVGRAKH